MICQVSLFLKDSLRRLKFAAPVGGVEGAVARLTALVVQRFFYWLFFQSVIGLVDEKFFKKVEKPPSAISCGQLWGL